MRVLSRSRHWWALSRSGHWRAPIEEQAPEGAVEERALEGAFKELSLEGALKAQAQQSAFEGLVLEHALGWSELRPAGLRETDDGGHDFGATDDSRLVLAWGRTLSRHRRIPFLQLNLLVSGRSTGQ